MFVKDQPLRVLHVDDNRSFVDLLRITLEQINKQFSVEGINDVEAALERLAGGDIDCIVSDYDMPALNGIEFLETVREGYPDLPFVLFTGKGSEEIASEAVAAGVTSYLQKGTDQSQFTVLTNRIENAVGRYRAEQEAELKRRQFEAITESIADAILVVDGNGIIRVGTSSTEALFGYPVSQLIGAPLTKLMPERYHDEFQKQLTSYLRKDDQTIKWEPIKLFGQHRDGHEILVSVSFNEFEQDGDTQFVGSIRDITEWNQVGNQLKETQNRLKQMAGNISQAVWITNPDQKKLIYVNPAYQAIWGLSAESLRESPTSFIDAVHPDDRDRVANTMAAEDSGAYDEEYRILRPDGDVRWVHNRVVPVRSDTGDVYRRVGIASDITKHKTREAELEQKNQILEEFTSTVSHDLRTPLTVIGGRLELAQQECESDHLYAASEALERGWELIEDLLMLTRDGLVVGEMEAVTLREIVDSCWADLGTDEATLTILTERVVTADRERLRQLIENIVRNALEHGGEDVCITIGDLDDGFYIEDNGPGIPTARHKAVVEPGYSASETRTGLGLAIVRRIAEGHGWRFKLIASNTDGARLELRQVESRQRRSSVP
jgi:PAS domain S-box-containing protein